MDDQDTFEVVKGTHFGVRASAHHNFLLNKYSQYKTRYDLIRGGKIKWYFCDSPYYERLGYLRNFHPTEITTAEGVNVDYDTQFEKCAINFINSFTKVLGLSDLTKNLRFRYSIF